VALRYVEDDEPGIARRRRGSGFEYRDPDGRRVSAADRKRIEALVIPPAWLEVWICRSADGHLQATGRDQRGRKQYRYHDHWREIRDQTKYHRVLAFGSALPEIRRRVSQDMARRKLSKDRVVATVVHLLDLTNIRVGNDEYARENNSFGLTTLKDRHVSVSGSTLRFRFRGKGGKDFDIACDDRRAARTVRRLEELPGQRLFQYLDDDGELGEVDSDDVNAYLHDVAGDGYSAKDFRTWTGTVLAACALERLGPFDSAAGAKQQAVAAVRSVAGELGNTPAVCRRCYIHPEVFEAHRDGSLQRGLRERSRRARRPDRAGGRGARAVDPPVEGEPAGQVWVTPGPNVLSSGSSAPPASGRPTSILPSRTRASIRGCAKTAGPSSTAPVRRSNREPCHGQITLSPSRVPSASGPPRWVQTLASAHTSPLRLRASSTGTPSTLT
jgi:DNA topoisomerase-1